ncbi:3'-5' exonuclease [Promicromonospora sp. NPDC052451]|uniref:3'-5' exonuclease n=1 Tax=Promicromonospora sp. NPDC052451 TaxID=3364407 RepID=UPI0037C98199
MPQVIIPSDIPSIDDGLRSQVWGFIEKLRKNDTTPGLHIEPMTGAADRRARIGRVNDNFRAVLIQLTGSDGESRYVYLGTFEHDEAIAYAKNVVFRRNAQTSGAEVIRVDQSGTTAKAVPERAKLDATSSGTAAAEPPTGPAVPILQVHGVTFEELIELGIAPLIAYRAISAVSQEELLEIALAAPSVFQTDALLWLADGKSVREVRATYDVEPVAGGTSNDTDDDLIDALEHTTSRLEFTYLEDDEELRAAIDGTFAAWRVFLHPEQTAYATAATKGAFRLSGGAGTGKTVVLLHRARHLHRKHPDARIILTTFNKTLAGALEHSLRQLDKGIRIAKRPGDAGVHVATVDAVSWHLIAWATEHGLDLPTAAQTFFGRPRSGLLNTTEDALWDTALRHAGQQLPESLRQKDFFIAEYAAVIVPRAITTVEEYLHTRRPGRGIGLGRALRLAVWKVVEVYRSLSDGIGATDFDERARIVALALDKAADDGAPRMADHLLVDEAQDLTPARLLLLRALCAPGPDDLFLADDSQQRIYVPRTVLSRHGIHVTGRSRRLRLNYRTTAQNLDYAVSVLAGHDLVDLEDQVVDDSEMRSARTGPPPELIGRSTLEEAYQTTVGKLRSWLADGVLAETVAVLVKTKNDASAVHQRLVREGIPSQNVGSREVPGADRVVVMTMHRSKGMEFRNVLIFGAAAGSTRALDRLHQDERPDALQRERSLLYVAITRPRDRLTVVWHGAPSELLPQQAPRPVAAQPASVRSPRNTVEAERAEFAREVHDSVTHYLGRIGFAASALAVESADPEVRELSKLIRADAQSAHVGLRSVLVTLRSGADGRREVSFADLTILLNEFKGISARITSTVDLTEGHTANGDLTRACYRIVQESVTNAMRHASGLPIDIALRGAPGTGVTIVVTNPLPDGLTGLPRPSSGITGMSARAAGVGGALSAGPSGGFFRVDARLPWPVG